MKKEFIEGKHFYLENGRIVFTEQYHLERGHCCAKGCRHCPYDPKSLKGNRNLNENLKTKNS